MQKNAQPIGMAPIPRNLTDTEARLYCLDLAVRALTAHGVRTPGLGPIGMAEQFFDYAKSGKVPGAAAARAPLRARHDGTVGHGKPPAPGDMAAGGELSGGGTGDDLTPGGKLPGGGNPSLNQAGGKE